MSDKNIIQMTRSQLDRYSRNIAVTIAKQIIGDIDDTDSKNYTMTQKDAAEYIGVDVSTLRLMQRKRQIRGKLVGSRLKYCREELEQYRN